MKKLAGYGIFAGMFGVVIGVLLLLGMQVELMTAVAIFLAGFGVWFSGVMLGAWLWDEVHWSLAVLVWLVVIVIAPPLVLPLASIPWWVAYFAYGVCLVMALLIIGVGWLGEKATELIES